MKRKIPFFIPFFIIFHLNIAQAKIIIWQIGNPDGSYREFLLPKKKVIDYQVPSNWEAMLSQKNPVWGEFPLALYPQGSKEDDPQEIRINFDYQKGHGNPVLTIRTMKGPSTLLSEIIIQVLKGEDDLLYEEKIKEEKSFYPYNFPLACIKKGLHEQNKIIIRINGPPDLPIIFDAIYLSFEDSDGDGVYDSEEGGPYLADESIVCIPIQNYSPYLLSKKIIILEIAESPEATPLFREVKFRDPNTLDIPEWLQSERFIPHGYLGFKIEGISPLEQVKIQFKYINTINPDDILDPSLCFYSYQDTAGWQETPFEFLEENSVMITLSDGGIGDVNDQKNGVIETILAQTYSKNLGAHLEGDGCFLKVLAREKK